MRTQTLVAAVTAITLVVPAATPAAAGNPLSSLVSCSASGSKQEGGALIGAIIGGVVGNRVAKGDRGLGTAIGAVAGAGVGSYIGCRMQKSDQAKAEQAARDALNANRNASWTNPQTGASGSVRMLSSTGAAPLVHLGGLRLASGVDLASGYEGAGGRYQARGYANLRGGPAFNAPVVGHLKTGEQFDALARVQGGGWLLAGREGVGVGYVAESLVEPAGGMIQASGPVCRTFDQTLQAGGGAPETQRYTACRDPNGEWVVS